MNRLFAYNLAEDLPPVEVFGNYDSEQQLWVCDPASGIVACSCPSQTVLTSKFTTARMTGTGYNSSDSDTVIEVKTDSSDDRD
jgi:hypothetical protein